MILLAETPVKYRDGTVKSLDELGGEAKELAPDTPVVNGSTSKPLDEFIQDQIVLSPDTVVVDGEDTTTLEDFIEEEIDGNTGVVHKTGTEEITGTKTFKDEVRVNTTTLLTNMLTKYEGDGIETNAEEFTVTGQEKLTLDSDVDVDGDLAITGDLVLTGKVIGAIKYVDISMGGKSIPSNSDYNTWYITSSLPANSTIIGWVWQGSIWLERVIISIMNDPTGGEISLCAARNIGVTGDIDFNSNLVIRIFYI